MQGANRDIQYESAHRAYRKKIAAEIKRICLDMSREHSKKKDGAQKISHEALKKELKKKLGALLVDAYKEYLVACGFSQEEANALVELKNDGTVSFKFAEDNIDKLKDLMPKDAMGDSSDKVYFLRGLAADLNEELTKDAQKLAELLLDPKKAKVYDKDINELTEKYEAYKYKMCGYVMCAILLAAYITGAALLTSSGILPIAVLVGVCTSSVFFILARSDDLIKFFSSIPEMIKISQEIKLCRESGTLEGFVDIPDGSKDLKEVVAHFKCRNVPDEVEQKLFRVKAMLEHAHEKLNEQERAAGAPAPA